MYKKPAAMFQIFSVWTNTAVMSKAVILTLLSVVRGEWLWLGTVKWKIFLRVVALMFVGMALRRTIRVFPACGITPPKYAPWLFFLPWYLLLMRVMRLYSIWSMNRQGWVTRTGTGAGGFGKAPEVSEVEWEEVPMPELVDMPNDVDVEWGVSPSVDENDGMFSVSNPMFADVCCGDSDAGDCDYSFVNPLSMSISSGHHRSARF